MAGYRAPTADEVDAALRRITTPQLRRAFFEGLANPHWVAPLNKNGVFDSPPEPEKTDDGLVRDVYWPEIDYLIRAAPASPAAVVDVLLKHRGSNNAWLRRGTFTIASALPADQAARLLPLMKAWLPTRFGWRTDPRELVSTCVNLLAGGQPKAGRWLTNAVFRPGGEGRRRQASPLLDDHWYYEGLPRIVAALGDDGLVVVLPWLEEYERHIGHLTDSSDMSSFSRAMIRTNAEPDMYEQVEHALIDAVRDLAINAILSDAAAAIGMLLKANMRLARRIALFSLSVALASVSEGETDKLESLLAAARPLLYDKESLHEACQIEYADLARAAAKVSADLLEDFPQLFETDARLDREQLKEWLSRDEDDAAVLEQKVEEYNAKWRHRWLSAIGAEALPESLCGDLSQLDARFGVIEAPLESDPRVTGWTGPNSPITVEAMSVMTPAELVAHLESWHDPSDGWGPQPSHEGQARELTSLLTTKPEAVAGVARLVHRLRPTYLRAVLEGWSAAAKAGLELDWDEVLDLVGRVLSHEDKSAFPTEGGAGDDDVDFRRSKEAAVRLLQDLAPKRPGPTVPEAQMASIAEMLVDLAADEQAWVEYSTGGDRGMDPLTLSLNEQWAVRLRGLAYLVARGTDTPWYAAARSALEAELSRQDPHGVSRAVIGEAVGRLMNADPEWTKANISAWFGAAQIDANQQVALTTAMAVHRYHPALLDLLATPILAALRLSEPITVGWRNHADPVQKIGEWVIGAVIRGDRPIDDVLVQAFFSDASAKVRGHAVGHIAWEFMHADRVDDEIRDRFAALWDSRVTHVRTHPEDHEEVHHFHWFVKSKKFDIEWWLPRLHEVLELDADAVPERYTMGKEVARAADVDPRQALAVLKLLVDGGSEASLVIYDLNRNAIPMVIARAIASGDGELKIEAEAYMNHLGEVGYLRLDEEVKAVLAGAVTQDDVDE